MNAYQRRDEFRKAAATIDRGFRRALPLLSEASPARNGFLSGELSAAHFYDESGNFAKAEEWLLLNLKQIVA